MTITKNGKYQPRRDMRPHPLPDEIRAARSAANLSQHEAGQLLYTSNRHWSNWETGASKMPRAAWHLFCILTGQNDKLEKTA